MECQNKYGFKHSECHECIIRQASNHTLIGVSGRFHLGATGKSPQLFLILVDSLSLERTILPGLSLFPPILLNDAMKKRLEQNDWPIEAGTIDGVNNPYLTAFPGEGNMLDLYTLKDAVPQQGMADWLSGLLREQAEPLPLQVSYDQDEQLWHFYRESINAAQSKFSDPLQVGFPVLRVRRADGSYAAPLFLWRVRLRPDPYQGQRWYLGRNKPEGPRLNPFIGPLLKTFFPSDKLPEGGNDRVHMLLQFLEQHSGQATRFGPLPSLSSEKEAQLAWSALLGVFPHPAHLFTRKAVWKGWPDQCRPADGPVFPPHQILDPNQQEAFAKSQSQPVNVVRAPVGTGEKLFIETLVVQALANGQRVLVVSDRPPTIPFLQNRMEALGLPGMGFALRRLEEDSPQLQQLLFLLAKQQGTPITFDKMTHERDLRAYHRLETNFQQRSRAVRKPCFGNLDWTETVGLFLRSSQKAGRELLANSLRRYPISHTMEEYEALRRTIRIGQPLYESLGTLHHPLNAVQDRLFLTLNAREAHDFLSRELDLFISEFSKLQHAFILSLNRYTDGLRALYDDYYRRMRQHLEGLFTELEEGERQYGDDFMLTSNLSIKIYEWLSGRVRSIAQMRERVREKYRRLVAAHQLEDLMPYEFPQDLDTRNMRTLAAGLKGFEEALDKWNQGHTDRIAPLKKSVSITQFHPKLNWSTDAELLQKKLTALLNQLQDRELLNKTPANRAITLDGQQQFIEQVLGLLDHLQLSLRDFPAFYDWRHFWLHQSAGGRAIIEAMARVKATDWEASFSSWYLDQVLHEHQNEHIPENSFLEEKQGHLWQKLRASVADRVAFVHGVRRFDFLTGLRRKQKSLYQRLFIPVAEPQNLPLPMDRTTAEAVSEMVPALFTTSLAARQAFSTEGGPVFDLLIFDASQYIDAHLGSHLGRLARRIVLTGDECYGLEDQKNDLLEAALEQPFPQTTLRRMYRFFPAHPDQLRQGHLFDPSAADHTSHNWYQVDGRYDEVTQTNSAEAEAVVHALNRIEKTVHRTYPKVGIITGTVGQRNVLARMIDRARQANDESDTLIRQLERNGLAILSMDELSGHEFHTVFFSPTYGIANLDGTMTRHIGRWNTPAGQRQVYELLTAASHHISVFSSISAFEIDKMLEQPTQNGTHLMAQFLRLVKLREGYAFATSSEPDRDPEPLEPIRHVRFLLEVGDRLIPFFGKDRIQFEARPDPGGWPLTVQPEEQQGWTYWLVPEGLLAQDGAPNANWELAERDRLADLGIRVIPLWSLRWWRNPEEEARRVASHLFNLDKEVYGT